MVALLKKFYGRAPTPTTSYCADDLFVCVRRGGFTRVEETLLEGGRGAAVIEQRIAFQESMRERFEAVIEDTTGRRVIGLMSGNQQHPDMMCEVFILAPNGLVGMGEIRPTGRARCHSSDRRLLHGVRAGWTNRPWRAVVLGPRGEYAESRRASL